MTLTDGSSYDGEWKDGEFNGKGTCTYADGRLYVGQFKDNEFHGQGIYTRSDKTKLIPVEKKGKFEKGEMVGSFTETKSDGTTRIVVNPEW